MAKTVMIADDSRSIRQMVRFTLSLEGYEVLEAENGKEALDIFDANRVHVLITDLHMPALDGVDLIREIRERPACRFLPILVLTTESQDERKQEGKAAGATGWIVKPFKAHQLLDAIRKVMQ